MEINNTPHSQDQYMLNGGAPREIVTVDGFPPKANPYDYLLILRRYKWLLMLLIIGGSALIITYLMMMPQTFTATATLLPPDKSESINLGSLLTKNAGIDLQGMSQNGSSEVFTTILGSRALGDSLVRRFDLVRRYGMQPGQTQRAADILLGGFDVTSDRHGIMKISYNASTGFSATPEEQARAARDAAEIVNEATGVLDYLNREKMIGSARRTREYLGRMIVVKRAQRDSIQGELLRFQQRNRAVALDKQVEASVSALTEIQSEIMKKELELSAAESELAPDSRTVQLLRSQLTELRRQKGSVESGGNGGSTIGLNLRNLPDVAREYANLKLDLEVATQVYTYLETQYHQEQVAEARDLPTVSVLDSAQVPEYRSSPRRGLAMMIALPALIIASLLFVFIIDYYRRAMRAGRGRRAEELATSTEQRRLEATTKV